MYLLIGVAGLLVVFLAVAATRPAAYRVERQLETSAATERVFAVLDDPQKLAGIYFLFGDPLAKSNPTFTARACSWGDGTLTIAERIPGQKVRLELEVVKPMKSKATIEITVAGTRVTWSMQGNHNFIGKAMSVVMNMDQAFGADIEKGLAQLKTVTERG